MAFYFISHQKFEFTRGKESLFSSDFPEGCGKVRVHGEILAVKNKSHISAFTEWSVWRPQISKCTIWRFDCGLFKSRKGLKSLYTTLVVVICRQL